MRVLIVGATGFVGRHLLAECRRVGDDLVATYRPGEEIPEGTGAEWLPLDLLDPASVREAVGSAGADALVHLAGQANVAHANEAPLLAFQVNAGGTVAVLAALRELAPDTRTLVISSAEVYGLVPPEELPVGEERPIDPRTPYGVSKAAAELAARQAAVSWKIPVTVMRPFNHVGPGQRIGFVAPDFASQVAAIEQGEREPVLRVGNLSGRRDFTDVRDIARGYRAALDSARPGEAYNLCSGTSVAIEEIVGFFVEQAAVDIEIREDPERVRPLEVPEFRGRPDKARAELGWTPSISLRESLAEVLDEWRAAAREVSHPTD